MAVQTAKAFRTALRKEPLQNFYYLYGADLVQVAELTDQLVQVATNQQPESALTKLDGKKLDLRELEDAAQMFSLFAPYNCILIHDLNAEPARTCLSTADGIVENHLRRNRSHLSNYRIRR